MKSGCEASHPGALGNYLTFERLREEIRAPRRQTSRATSRLSAELAALALLSSSDEGSIC
jgi:hypothetical protein